MNLKTFVRALPAAAVLLLTATGASAQSADGTRPFILPMLAPPGPQTWLLGQPYGNTIGAYLRGDQWYSAGQRLHFGLDFSMPCNTPLVAIGDGVVAFVDDMGFGSAPHNLLIRHDAGFVSLYGHLIARPPVEPGQRVVAGEIVGYSGDPDLTCTSRPHLHFELRSLDYQTTYNPVEYIDANWDMLSNIGSFRYPVFQQDLDNARQWMSLDDQPEVVFGGRALNLYAAPYPDYRSGQPQENPPLARTMPPLEGDVSASLTRLGYDGCCTGAQWDLVDSSVLYTIDGPVGQRASIFQWNIEQAGAYQAIGQAPPPFTSADGSHVIAPRGESEFAITRVADGVEYVVNTGGEFPSLSADNSKIMFMVTAEGGDGQPMTNIWVANVDGSNARTLLSFPGISARWLDADRLLLSVRSEQITQLSVVDVNTTGAFTIGQWERVRGLTIAPGGGRLMFYVTNQQDPTMSGTYTVETVAGAQPQKLDWFGAYTWRDADSVYYVPFDSTQSINMLRYYHVVTGEDRLLTDPATQPFAIANGDWSVSPDGTRIAFWNALDDTTWMLEVR
ncbi:MAG: peptidoglycan DD-metalloendopeptidase family protein [Pleurocapsa minor GSE-CHR-MK-17-07R]|jgi:murein DD-endopeptidase MepM/ murein hydrolase activator NlpD|nr:peptidoglycan DD-metalloendopeptidase family protein [Pleurocapsa minor GSE-CHR-MK 17-07R]